MSEQLTIAVLYSCTLCAQYDVSVCVPVRESAAVDVGDWMRQTVELIGADHKRRSPSCTAQRLSSLKVPPIENAAWIGGPVLE